MQNINTRRGKSGLENLWVLLSYAFISIMLTYPMIFRLNDFPYTGAESFPPGSDIFIYLWGMWWFKHAVLNLVNPFWTDYIFYPNGISLYITLGSVLWGAISVPLQSFLNIVQIYNLFFLASLVLGGMGAFWLIRYLTENNWAGFIGGVVFTFSPYHFAHIGHLTVFSIHWIPFFVLFFLKMQEENDWRNPVLAALFWAATCYSDLNYAAFIAVFIVLFFLYQLRYGRAKLLSKEYLKSFLIMGFALLVFAGPYAFGVLSSVFSGTVSISQPVQSSVNQSADLLSFFVPSFMHPIFGPIVRPFYERVTTFGGHRLGGFIEVTTFLGYTAIFLVIIALRKPNWAKLRFWIISAIFFFLLTLGPVLKVNGLVQIPAQWLHLDRIAHWLEPNLDPLALEMMKKSVGIPLPYLIWHFIPVLSGSESAGRLDAMFVLVWAVICGFGVKRLIENIRNQSFLRIAAYKIICPAILLLILFEYAAFPVKMMKVPISDFYKQISRDTGDYALLVLPLVNNILIESNRSNELLFGGFNSISSKQAMHNQTVHHKKIVNGTTCRFYKGVSGFIDNTPVVKLLVYPQEIKGNKLPVDTGPLVKNKIKYIILHRNYLTEDEAKELTQFLRNKFRPVYNDFEIMVYQTY